MRCTGRQQPRSLVLVVQRCRLLSPVSFGVRPLDISLFCRHWQKAMNKILGRIFIAFASLVGIVAGAYSGLLWSAMLSHREHSEEDVTYDWPQWVLGGAIAGGILVFAFLAITFAAVRAFHRRRIVNHMREQPTSEGQAVGVWPPAPKRLPPSV